MNTNKITKYEMVQIISTRAKHLSEGALSTIPVGDMICSIEIAKKEFEKKKLPIKIVRNFPNGKKIELDVNKMDF